MYAHGQSKEFGWSSRIYPRTGPPDCVQNRPAEQDSPGNALFRFRDFDRRASCNDAAAGVATAGAEVDNPVRRGDGIQIVLDQDHRVADGHQSVELAQEHADVLGMEAGGWLVEQVKGMAPAGPLELSCQLDALSLPATELGSG